MELLIILCVTMLLLSVCALKIFFKAIGCAIVMVMLVVGAIALSAFSAVLFIPAMLVMGAALVVAGILKLLF